MIFFSDKPKNGPKECWGTLPNPWMSIHNNTALEKCPVACLGWTTFLYEGLKILVLFFAKHRITKEKIHFSSNKWQDCWISFIIVIFRSGNQQLTQCCLYLSILNSSGSTFYVSGAYGTPRLSGLRPSLALRWIDSAVPLCKARCARPAARPSARPARWGPAPAARAAAARAAHASAAWGTDKYKNRSRGKLFAPVEALLGALAAL